MIWVFEGAHATSPRKTTGRREVVYLGGEGRQSFSGLRETEPELLLPGEEMQLGGRPWPGGHPARGNERGLPRLCSVEKTTQRDISEPVE